MVDSDLICNYKKCRKRLTTFVWVTSCSHIFCDEDGTREFNKAYNCPACESSLSGKFDIIRVDLQASEQYKSMVLAGQRPEVIMEICSRAIAFWSYQSHQERVYHEYVANKAREAKNQLEQYYEQLISRIQNELTTLKGELADKNKDLNEAKKKLSELSEKHMDKCRQHQKLQSMYDGLRRRSINPATMDDMAINRPDHLQHLKNSFALPLSTSVGLLKRTEPSKVTSVTQSRGRAPISPEREFSFRPIPTPDINGRHHDQEHSALDSVLPVTTTFQSKFSLQLNTPTNIPK